MITIINYGMGNIGSISNMLKKIGIASFRASNVEELLDAINNRVFDHVEENRNFFGNYQINYSISL